MRAALVALAVALVGLAAWQYLTPAAFESVWGLNPEGVAHFRAAYGVRAAPLALDGYRLGFRLLLVGAWAAYLALVLAGVGGGRLQPRTLQVTTAALAVAFALAWPLSLSVDSYRYVGYARLAALHHLNPYAASREALLELHDATAPFMAPDLPSPYGPLWTWLSIAVVWVLRRAGLFAQVVALKLLAAAALIVLARAGGALAERLRPGRGGLALAAIGCNPLFLIEGPGNGHNDFVMMALVMTALVAVGGGRVRAGALLIGCAAAVKFIPLLLVPWLVVAAVREAGPSSSWRRMAVAGAAVVGLALAPLLVAYAPLWRGAATLAGLGHHLHRTNSGTGGLLSAAGLAVTIAYLAGSALVLRRAGVDRIATAWVIASLAVLLTASGVWFPWYLVWTWSVLLTRWDRRHTPLSLLLLAFAIWVTLLYSVGP